jgi:hypothetical protein
MSERPPDNDTAFEQQIRETAQQFDYPATPDIAAKVQMRLRSERPRPAVRVMRLAAAALLALVLFGALWSVPSVRAAILQILRIGAVTVIVGEETPTSEPPAPTQTPDPNDNVYDSVLELPGETTLEDAAAQLGREIPLPTYPGDLGQPDHVYVETMVTPIVTLAWLEPGSEIDVRLVLMVVSNRGSVFKYEPWEFVRTEVNGVEALWFENPHTLVFYGGNTRDEPDIERRITMSVLLWETGGYTYRLETKFDMDEAVRVAESVG